MSLVSLRRFDKVFKILHSVYDTDVSKGIQEDVH